MDNKKYRTLILILGVLIAIPPFSIDMYLPGFSSIAEDLGTTVSKVSLSLSSFIVGISVGQLFYGPLLDRFGRKKPLFVGMSVYVIMSIACTLTRSLEVLIIFRFIQALGACACTVASISMVRDLFPVNEIARVFSFLILVLGVSPLLAPALGGYISTALGWQYVFIILTLIAVLMMGVVYWRLPESKEPDEEYSLRMLPVLKNYAEVFKNPHFSTFAFTRAIAFAGLFAYISSSPYIFMQLFELSEKAYGWIFALLASGVISSTQVNRGLLKRYSSQWLIQRALLVQLFTGFCLVALSVMGMLNLVSIIILIFIFLSSLGFILPNASALSLAPFTKNTGSASSLMGALQMGCGALASFILSMIKNDSTIPMTLTMAFCAMLASFILFRGMRHLDLQSAKA